MAETGSCRGPNRWGAPHRAWCEALEPRRLLSTAATVYPADHLVHADVPAGSIQGTTPSQIRKAYGFDQISDQGLGQTIAIVDPFNDPNVASDLAVFDAQFGIAAPPSLTVVNASGGSKLPRTDGSWAGEIATDVEWAHVIAPQAQILIVEAKSDGTDDLMTAVEYARTVPGVSVVSMSWGGSEFAGQTAYDPDFTTPAGHGGITFVAASGDSGPGPGAQWPASSTRVVAVGGTVLTLADSSGTYGSETSWIDTSGGNSKFEPEPSWQQVAQRSGSRSIPDVSLVADTNVGLALYDTVPYQGVVGWQTTTGTSVGTPQWAALVALADEARASAGQPALDGATQTLPVLYNLYSASGTPGYSAYGSYFNDITTPDSAQMRGLPTVGYDTATGLGTPKAQQVVTALTASPSASALAHPQGPLASQLTGSFVKNPPPSAVGGAPGKIALKLTNTSQNALAGPVSIALYAAVGPDVSSAAVLVATVPINSLKIRGHGSKTITLHFTYPAVPQNNYLLIAQVTATSGNVTPAEILSVTPVNIAAAYVNLSPLFSANKPVGVKPGKKSVATLLIRNLGNSLGLGTLGLNLFTSMDQALDAADVSVATVPSRVIRIKPGRSLTLHVRFMAPANQIPGTYYLIASILSSLGSEVNTAVTGTR